jgi:hypothetical protein
MEAEVKIKRKDRVVFRVGDHIEVINPFEAKYGLFFSNMSSGSGAGYTTGQHRTATSYTSFSMLPSAGSFSSGNIRVYGYND